METRNVGTILSRYWIAVIVFGLIGLLCGWWYSTAQTGQYRASSVVLVSPKDAATVSDLSQASIYIGGRMTTYADLTLTPSVLGPALESLDSDETLAEFTERVTSTNDPGTSLITVSVVEASAADAAEAANAVATALATAIPTLEAQPVVVDAPTGPVASVRVDIVQEAEPPVDPFGPGSVLVLVIGAIAGLVLGFLFAFIRSRFEGRVFDEHDVAELTDRPVLGRIPKSALAGLVVRDQPTSIAAESYRTLRTSLLQGGGRDLSGVFVVAPDEADGNTVPVAANLAVALAELGRRVLLIDADLRQGALSARLGFGTAPGLADVLGGGLPFDESITRIDGSAVQLMPHGGPTGNPAELVASPLMEATLESARSHFDLVLVNAAPVSSFTDASLLASNADGLLLVAVSRRTRKSTLQRSVEVVAQARAAVPGIVLTRVARSTGVRVGSRRAAAPTLRTSGTDPELAELAGMQRRMTAENATQSPETR